MNDDELPEYVRELIYRAIATKLKIRRDNLTASPEVKARVDRCLMTVKAIADNQTLDGAIDDLLAKHSGRRDVVSRKAIQREVNACCDTFNTEIAGIERMYEMHHLKIEPKAIWDFLRSRVLIGSEYEDTWLLTADAWILGGEKLHLTLGVADIYSVSDAPSPDEPEDEETFIHQTKIPLASKPKTRNA